MLTTYPSAPAVARKASTNAAAQALVDGPSQALVATPTRRLSQAVFDALLSAGAPCESCRRHAAQYLTELDDTPFIVCAGCLP